MDDTADYSNQDEWELVNDDGFVYKRKKQAPVDPTASSFAAPPPPDAAAERKHRRERKKRALVKLRERYLKEISHWELFSNTLREMEHNAQAQVMDGQEVDVRQSVGEESRSIEQSDANSNHSRVIDDLLSQVESQETIIRDVSNLCDVAEALCSAQEERLKQHFTELSIWDPLPHELMATLG